MVDNKRYVKYITKIEREKLLFMILVSHAKCLFKQPVAF